MLLVQAIEPGLAVRQAVALTPGPTTGPCLGCLGPVWTVLQGAIPGSVFGVLNSSWGGHTRLYS